MKIKEPKTYTTLIKFVQPSAG